MAERIIPIKIGACINCGESVQIKTNPKVLCAVCKVSRKRERSVIGASFQRRKKGIQQVKDVPISCSDCGLQFLRASFRAVRCVCCQRSAALARARETSKLRYSTREGKDAANAYYSRLYKTNHRWAIRARMRSLMHRALGTAKAGRSWTALVPYTLDEFVRHIERQFLPGMSWGNRGEWHIDHITPASKFKYTSVEDPDFKACWALSNLRPLWATDNLQKNATITYLL